MAEPAPIARNYAAERLTVDSVEIVRLTDQSRSIELSIVPSVGNIAYDLRVRDTPILVNPTAKLSDWKANPSNLGIPFLAPWANRIDGDTYWANGKKYLLNPHLGNLRRDPNGLPIHGLLLFAPDWRVLRMEAGESYAEVSSRLEFWRNPEWMAQFPFAQSIELTHRLADGVLEVQTSIENLSTEPMPLCVGFHPWYQIPDSPRDSWTVHVPVREHYKVSSSTIPTGETEPANLPDRFQLSGRQFDDVFRRADSTDEFWVEAEGRRISVRFGPKFPVAVVYAPQTKNLICFEPMTAITNAFNLAHAGLFQDLPATPPGETWTESFWIRADGF